MKTSIRILVLIFALITLLSFTACDGEDNVGDGDKPTDDPSGDVEQSLTLNKAEISIAVGNSETLTVTALPEGCEGKQLTWSSSDPSIVMVNAEGKVSALDIGSATVTVKVNGTEHEAKCSVTVTPIYVSSITVNKTELSLTAGQSEKLTVNVMPINASNRSVKWESSDPTVATVSAGTVTAHKNGTAVITAKAADGSGMSATCTVTVKSLSVASVTLNKSSMQIDKGEKVKLVATVYPANAENKLVTWSSSNPSVISVDEFGNVKALKPGSATVTATAGGKKASCTVNAVAVSASYVRGVEKTAVVVEATDTKKDGIDVLYWQASSEKRVNLGAKKDYSEFDTVRFKVYSENTTGNTVQIRFSYADDDKDGTVMAPYYKIPITVDFTGWKEFEISFADIKNGYSPNWTRIAYVSFDCSGWDLSPNAATQLYFSDIEMIKYGYKATVQGSKTEAQYLSAIKTSWKEAYTGNGGTSNAYRTRVKTIESNALKFWKTNSASYVNTFVGTGTDKKGTLFGISPAMNWDGAAKLQDIYWRIQAMALGYATSGTSCYHNAELLTAIRNSLEYMYNNYYGEQHLSDVSYSFWVGKSNWWEWQIGTPSYVVDILMILSDTLSQSEIDKYLVPVDFFVPRVSMTACNRLWLGKIFFGSAILKGETGKALFCIDELNEIFEYVTEGDGFYTDGSFIQHESHPYTGAYGVSLLDELSDFMAIVTNTPFGFDDEVSAPYYDWMFDSFRPLMYKSNFMSMVRGRDIVRSGISENTRFLDVFSNFLITSQFAPETEQERLLSLIKYFIDINGVNMFVDVVKIKYIDLVYEIAEDETIDPDSDYELTKVFGNMDRIVQHLPKYSVGIALSSTRILKYEAINGENGKGWYNGDGTVYIYTDGTDFDDKYFNNSDALKRPGTTVSNTVRVEENLSGGIFGSSDFAGGVEHGKYGAAAFVLGYSQNNYYNTDITAKKSYFLFDNEIICIGSGIAESTLGDDVYTTVENRLWKTSDVFTVDGVRKTGDGSAVAKYMYFSGMGGYVFDGETTVDYSKHVANQSYLEITVSHGKTPTDGRYFFAYLPTATAAETKAYSDSLSERITVISDSGSVHAVKDNDIGVTGYVFFDGGVYSGDEYNIYTQSSCVIMVSEGEDGSTIISVSDPTQLLTRVKFDITVEGATEVTCENKSVSKSIDGNRVSIDLDVSGSCGATYTVIVK